MCTGVLQRRPVHLPAARVPGGNRTDAQLDPEAARVGGRPAEREAEKRGIAGQPVRFPERDHLVADVRAVVPHHLAPQPQRLVLRPPLPVGPPGQLVQRPQRRREEARRPVGGVHHAVPLLARTAPPPGRRRPAPSRDRAAGGTGARSAARRSRSPLPAWPPGPGRGRALPAGPGQVGWARAGGGRSSRQMPATHPPFASISDPSEHQTLPRVPKALVCYGVRTVFSLNRFSASTPSCPTMRAPVACRPAQRRELSDETTAYRCVRGCVACRLRGL